MNETTRKIDKEPYKYISIYKLNKAQKKIIINYLI